MSATWAKRWVAARAGRPRDRDTDAPTVKPPRPAPPWRAWAAIPAAALLGMIGFYCGPLIVLLLFGPSSYHSVRIGPWFLPPVSGAVGGLLGLTIGLRLGGFRWLTALGASLLIVVSVVSTIVIGVLTVR